MNKCFLLPILSMMACGLAFADSPVVENVQVTAMGADRWRIDVTVSHADSGWQHYANGWRIVDEAGEALGFRVLYHPHESEQPFTRGLALHIPNAVESIRVQAVDSVHGTGSLSEAVKIPR